jgi:predicted nucleic-acid-binding Zn-ribbon protein
MKQKATKVEIIDGEILKCPICNHDNFWFRRTKMNTTGMTLFRLDWLNKSAESYICDNCGYVYWFMKKNE